MALQSIWPRQFSRPYSIVYCIVNFLPIRMSSFIFFNIFRMSKLAFFALSIALLDSLIFFALKIGFSLQFAFCAFSIALLSGFTFVALSVLFLAYFTPRSIAICITYIFVKFRQWFDFFAFRALFGYALLRHGRISLIERLCLEPVARHALAVGSLYCNRKQKRYQMLIPNI